MTMQEGPGARGLGTAARYDRAYFLDQLGDSLAGLGRHEAAIEAYREAGQGFEALVRYFSLAQDHLAACRAELASLLGGPPPLSDPARSGVSSPGRG